MIVRALDRGVPEDRLGQPVTAATWRSGTSRAFRLCRGPAARSRLQCRWSGGFPLLRRLIYHYAGCARLRRQLRQLRHQLVSN